MPEMSLCRQLAVRSCAAKKTPGENLMPIFYHKSETKLNQHAKSGKQNDNGFVNYRRTATTQKRCLFCLTLMNSWRREKILIALCLCVTRCLASFTCYMLSHAARAASHRLNEAQKKKDLSRHIDWNGTPEQKQARNRRSTLAVQWIFNWKSCFSIFFKLYLLSLIGRTFDWLHAVCNVFHARIAQFAMKRER